MSKYNPLLTLKKGLIILAEIVVAGALVYVTERQEFLALVPMLEMLRNYFKHKDTNAK